MLDDDYWQRKISWQRGQYFLQGIYPTGRSADHNRFISHTLAWRYLAHQLKNRFTKLFFLALKYFFFGCKLNKILFNF